MLIPQSKCPIDYQMCRQTVTVYHKEKDRIVRTVYKNAFLDMRKNRNVDKTGSREGNAFLLVIPCNTQAVFIGDKVLLGTGREVAPEDWPNLIPAKTPGLCVVKHADPKYWGNQMVHVEAGG